MDAGAKEPGKVVAFYSFKGGTGRSMALANIGCILAHDPEVGGPVLMVDWDLEAPGLHRYFRRHLFRAFRGDEKAQELTFGLIDLFIDMRNRIDEMEAGAHQDFESAVRLVENLPLSEYVIKTDIPGLHLIKAGRFDQEYAQRVGTFDWQNLYARSSFLLRSFVDRLASEYRYVLVDSRTGLTDTSGICTMLLPEILVTVFTPNRQSLDGVINLVRDAGRYRARSDDLRPLMIYPLPSRIEASEPSLRQLWRLGAEKEDLAGFQKEFEEAFREIYGLKDCDLETYFDDVQIQHVPKYAYGEEIAVLVEESRDRFSLTRSFQRFSKRLISGQLPWITSSASDEEEGERESLPSSYERVRDDSAAAYIRNVSEQVAKLESRAKGIARAAYFFTVAAIGLIVAVGAFALGIDKTLAVLSFSAVAFSVVGALLAPRIVPANEIATEVNREVEAFKNKQAPYDRDDALERLRNRVQPVLAQAEGTDPRKREDRVYVSYRREDAGYVTRLNDSISRVVGIDRMVFDLYRIPLGVDFRTYLVTAIETADIMLVVIGPNWLMSERLRDPDDFVRGEIATAIKKNKLVVPVLVGGAAMPLRSELPEDIQELAFKTSVTLSHTSWNTDVLPLIETINRAVGV